MVKSKLIHPQLDPLPLLVTCRAHQTQDNWEKDQSMIEPEQPDGKYQLGEHFK